MAKEAWWQGWVFLSALALLSVVPLILPETPPLVDVPGHIGRYKVQLDADTSTSLQTFFTFKWALIGNLGVDLLIIPLAPLFGLELGVKLIVVAIPVLTVLGIFWVVREVHGAVPPTALFAVPFVYGYPFNFGFINFSLSIAFALLALALWIRLGDRHALRLRAILFVPLSCLIWVAHAFGWGVLGLTAWSAELVRQHETGRTWTKSAMAATVQSSVLSLPLLLMIFWRSGGVSGQTTGFFEIALKAYSLTATLRDRWLIWDSLGLAVAMVLIAAAFFDRRLEVSRRLMLPASVMAVIFLLLPDQIFGSAYADMRVGPLMMILAVCAVRLRDPTDLVAASRLAGLGIVFIFLRFGGNTLSFAIADQEARERLVALDHIPRGARVLSLIGHSCGDQWEMPRHGHLGSFVITRREGFSNDQWQMKGAQLLRVRYTSPGRYQSDPSELVYSSECLKPTDIPLKKGYRIGRSINQALAEFPRPSFDFVWIIRPFDFDYAEKPGLIPVWRGKDSILYRVSLKDSPHVDYEAIAREYDLQFRQRAGLAKRLINANITPS